MVEGTTLSHEKSVEDKPKEALQEFVDTFSGNRSEITNYRRSETWGAISVMVGLLCISAIIYERYLQNSLPEMFVYPTPKILFPVALVLGSLSTLSGFLFFRNMNRYDVTDIDNVYFDLAKAIEIYLDNGDTEELLNHLNEFKQRTGYGGLSFIHISRNQDLANYLEKLEQANKSDDLDSVLEDTFEPIIGRIVGGILLAVNDEETEELIDDITLSKNETPSWKDTFSDALEPISQRNIRKIVVLGIMSVISLVVGVGFGAQWAVLILTIYMIYLIYEDESN